jgi:hypothetical protein
LRIDTPDDLRDKTMNEQFEKDKVCYEQHSESFRNLNTQMWQVPIIAMTLTGGLWFGIFSGDIEAAQATWLLIFCGVCDLLFIAVLYRVRFIMSLLIEKISQFNPTYAINPKSLPKGNVLTRQENLVIGAFSTMLFLAAIVSFIAAVENIQIILCLA